jgi:hypothetical protein
LLNNVSVFACVKHYGICGVGFIVYNLIKYYENGFGWVLC